MDIVLIDKSNFGYGSMDSFSRYQVVENVYRLIDGTLQLVHHPFTENWSLERKREKAKEILNGKYTVYGAFENGDVIGIIMLLPELDRNRMIIDSFHVSADKRRQGIGRALFEAAKNEAKKAGLTTIEYIRSKKSVVAIICAPECLIGRFCPSAFSTFKKRESYLDDFAIITSPLLNTLLRNCNKQIFLRCLNYQKELLTSLYLVYL